jgi:hypothetical protein
MKKFRKQRYVRLARKMILFALPALVLTFGSCSNEDEVIELTSDDFVLEVSTEVDADVPDFNEDLNMKRIGEDVLADGDAALGKLNFSGATRLYFTSSKKLFGSVMRLYTTNTSATTAYYKNKTYYMQSMVIPPYSNVRLFPKNGGNAQTFNNRYGSEAKYIADLGAPFTNAGNYVFQVEVSTYSQKSTEQLCGYAYYNNNFQGAQMPVFRSTPRTEKENEDFGRTAFESYQTLTGSKCGGVDFINTDDRIYSSNRDKVGVTVEGANDNTDLGARTYDAFHPFNSFSSVNVSGFTNGSATNIRSGFAAAATDNRTGKSSTETLRCDNGANTCFAIFSTLSQVSDFGAKLNCKGMFGVWTLMTKFAQIIANKQWYKLGLLMGDAVQVYAGLGTPVGEAMAGFCVVFTGLRTLTGVINSTWCSSLQTDCENAAQNGTGGRDDYINDF